jgi:proteasome assembly chaperone (PAC2) family protein
MGGMATDNFTDHPKVYVGGTDADLVKELEMFGAVKLAGGAITGTNGLIFGLAKPKNLSAICLLAETPGFLSLDANAAKSALEMSSKLLNIRLDYSALEKQASENSDAVHKARDFSRGNLPRDRDLSYVS